MTAAVVDNTLLSNFAHIQRPKLLEAAFDQPVIVRAVMDELEVGMQSGRIPTVDWNWLPVIRLTDEEHALAERLNQTLGRGEAECIALAQSRQWIILTDDRDARRAAREAGLIVSGTLGALMNMVRSHALSFAEADEFLATMKRSGYRCPVNSLTELDAGL
jgi:predicted nucleic acid-binding protein